MANSIPDECETRVWKCCSIQRKIWHRLSSLSLSFSLILSHTLSHSLPLSLYFCTTTHSHSFLDQNTLSLSLTLYLLKTTLTFSFFPKNWGWSQIENSIVKEIYSTDFSRRINLHKCTWKTNLWILFCLKCP